LSKSEKYISWNGASVNVGKDAVSVNLHSRVTDSLSAS